MLQRFAAFLAEFSLALPQGWLRPSTSRRLARGEDRQSGAASRHSTAGFDCAFDLEAMTQSGLTRAQRRLTGPPTRVAWDRPVRCWPLADAVSSFGACAVTSRSGD